MPVARLADLVSATIAHVTAVGGLDPATIATATISARAGEKAYEELMTEDESTRAYDIGEMYAVLPSIDLYPEVSDAYRDLPRAPVGAYRSDGVEPMSTEAVHRLVADALGRSPVNDRRDRMNVLVTGAAGFIGRWVVASSSIGVIVSCPSTISSTGDAREPRRIRGASATAAAADRRRP